MAGIRPQARGGAFTGVHIALVVFVVLWLVSTIGLVILYTGQAKLDGDREEAIKAKDKVANSGEFAQYQSLAKTSGGMVTQTVLGRMAEERRGMAKAITGTEESDWPSVKRQMDEKYTAIKDAKAIDGADTFDSGALSLLAAVDSLYNGMVREKDLRGRAEAALKQAQAQVTDLTKARETATQQFDQAVASIASELKDTQARLSNYQKANEQVMETLKSNASKAEEQVRKDADRHRGQLEEQDKELTKMRNRLNDALATLKQMRGMPDSYAAARQADGKIVRALPGDPYVYINLGAKDRLTLGMTFSIYGAGEGIPVSGEGKGTIEITSIHDDVAAGKIVSRNGSQPIFEGDLVANAIYSKNRKHKFVVVGRFDLDNTGVPTAASGDRIKAMVAEWGGEVVDVVDTTTDFVVVGQGPAQPIAPPASASPIDKQRYQEAQKAFDDFQSVLAEAKSLMVPILNTSQFTNFVGYNLNALRNSKVATVR